MDELKPDPWLPLHQHPATVCKTRGHLKTQTDRPKKSSFILHKVLGPNLMTV